MSATSQTKPGANFLSLPRELRDQILSPLVPDIGPAQVNPIIVALVSERVCEYDLAPCLSRSLEDAYAGRAVYDPRNRREGPIDVVCTTWQGRRFVELVPAEWPVRLRVQMETLNCLLDVCKAVRDDIMATIADRRVLVFSGGAQALLSTVGLPVGNMRRLVMCKKPGNGPQGRLLL